MGKWKNEDTEVGTGSFGGWKNMRDLGKLECKKIVEGGG